MTTAEHRYSELREAILFLDSAGVIASVTPFDQPVIGYDPKHLIGRPLVTLIASAQRAQLQHWLALAQPRQGAELEGRRHDGTAFPLRVSLVPTSEPGFVAILSDSTEPRILRQESSAAHTAADKALQDRRHFLAEMSHELRTPLNAILGFAEVIADQHFGPDASDRYRQYAEHIVASAQQLRDLIADLGASLPAATNDEAERLVSVQAMVAEVSDRIRPGAHAKNITIATTIQGDPTIRGEPSALRQILLNIATGAIANTPDNGQVTFSATTTEDGRLSLAVTDSSGGIEAAELPLLFDPHRRGSAQGDRPGLSVIKTLVEIHGGEFTIDSIAGQGATYRVALPGDRWSPAKSDKGPSPT